MRDHLILRKLKVWCLLLLAAVFAHALLPIPEARVSGSAFSPSTVEVSTGHTHRTTAVRIAIPRRDPPTGDIAIAEPALAAVPCKNAQVRPARADAAPRPGWRGARSQPRAPPFA
ncbi:hypothetical protein [Novosphingobium gossypii]|uniref:hypothetical protein n=1 Tax=Novosphingobium gossypii TaxID=1604774 RepID=UPI003D1B6D21